MLLLLTRFPQTHKKDDHGIVWAVHANQLMSVTHYAGERNYQSRKISMKEPVQKIIQFSASAKTQPKLLQRAKLPGSTEPHQFLTNVSPVMQTNSCSCDNPQQEFCILALSSFINLHLFSLKTFDCFALNLQFVTSALPWRCDCIYSKVLL